LRAKQSIAPAKPTVHIAYTTKIGHAFEVSIVEVESLETVTMISAEASTAHQEQVLHKSTWEVKFQMPLEFQARNNHRKLTQGNSTQLLYSWVRNERQLYNKDPQAYDPLHFKQLTELVFQYSLNREHTIIFSEGSVFLTEFFKHHGHCVVPTQYPQNQQLAHWANYLRRIKSQA
jgi:hypothetical protein